MKKQFLFVLLILPLLTFSQGFGVRAGINFANMTLNDDNGNPYDGSYSSIKGFSFGANYDLSLNEKMFIEVGLNYSQKGIVFKEVDSGEILTTKLKLNYLEVPVVFKYSHEINSIRIYGKLGPYIGYGLSGKETQDWSDSNDFDGEDTNIFGDDLTKNIFKPLEIGLKLGAGVVFKKFEFGFDYGFTLNNFALQEKYEAKNKVFRLTVGYRFKQIT